MGASDSTAGTPTSKQLLREGCPPSWSEGSFSESGGRSSPVSSSAAQGKGKTCLESHGLGGGQGQARSGHHQLGQLPGSQGTLWALTSPLGLGAKPLTLRPLTPQTPGMNSLSRPSRRTSRAPTWAPQQRDQGAASAGNQGFCEALVQVTFTPQKRL